MALAGEFGGMKKIIATFDNPAAMRSALATRRKELGLTQLALDDASGGQSGYSGKIEAGVKNLGPMSMPCILGALGVEMAIVASAASQEERAETSEAYACRLKKRFSDMAKKRWALGDPEETRETRRKAGRAGAKVRWRKWREAKAERERREKRKGSGKAKAAPGPRADP
jgi:hypothetical protein